MEKFIPYEKLSKKEKRKADQARRRTWGATNPVTRKPENSRAYNRRRSQDWKRELPPKSCDFFLPVRFVPWYHGENPKNRRIQGWKGDGCLTVPSVVLRQRFRFWQGDSPSCDGLF